MANRYLITGGGSVTWNSSNTAIWSASSGGATGASVPVDGDAVIMDGASGGGTVTLGYNPTVTSITCGAFTGTLDFSTFSPTMDTFNASGTGTRTITMTNMGTMTLRGSSATIFTTSTNTNLTFNVGGTIKCTYSGSTGTRTISTNNTPMGNLWISAGSDTVNTLLNCTDLNLTGFSGVLSFATSISSISGNLTLGTGMTFGGSQNFQLTSSGTANITTNGVTITKTMTINGTGTFTLKDDLNMTTGLVLTQGTLTAVDGANNRNVTCLTFSSSNSNTRTLTMGSGTWTLTGNNATIWTTATTTNLTITANTATINCTYSGGTGTRTLTTGASAALGLWNVNITAGTDSVALTTTFFCNNLNFTGFSGTLTNTSKTISGNLTLGAGMTVTPTGSTTTFTSTGTCTITSNSVVYASLIVINGVGGTFTFADDFSQGTNDGTRTFTLTNGTLDANNKNVTIQKFSSSNSNARTITMGSGTWTLTGTGTVWNMATATNLTLNRGTSTIKISDTSATVKTFSGGGKTFYNLWYANGAGGASLTFVGSNTFNSVRDTSTAAHSLIFTAGTTQTVPIGGWFVTGKSGAVTTLASTTTSAFTLTFTGVGTISSDYMSISYCTISLPDKEFFVGTHSTDGGNNTRVYFTAPTLHRSNFYLFM